MFSYPMNFSVSSASPANTSSTWEGEASSLSPIKIAIPPEFNGPGGGYSPEDLFALSLLTCFIATFKVYAEKSELTFETISGKNNITVERDENRVVCVTKYEMHIDLQGASDKAKAEKILEEVKKSCIIGNSVKSKGLFHIRVL